MQFFLQFCNSDGEGKAKVVKELKTHVQSNSGEEYHIIFVSLLARFCLDLFLYEEASLYLKEYEKLRSEITGNLADHPQIMVTRAFALAYCVPHLSHEIKELYGRALEEEVDVDWMYGQCLAIEKELRNPGKENDDDKRKLEEKLRSIAEKDPAHFQARISLAKQLILKDAFEEANLYIKEAEGSRNEIENSATKLEMLGSLYQMRNMSKLHKNHLDLAIDKFQGALSLSSQSEKAIHGYAKCLLIKYLNSNNKKHQEYDLIESNEYMEKLRDSSFSPHILTRAQIAMEIILLNKDKTSGKFQEVVTMYDQLISSNSDNHKVIVLCEAYWHYSVALKKYAKLTNNSNYRKKEVRNLKACVEADRNGPYDVVCNYAFKAQNQLLDYATIELRDGKEVYMTKVEALEFKSSIFSTNEDYISAIYYIRRAIDENDEKRTASQIESLAGLLLDASKRLETNEKGKFYQEAVELIISQLKDGEERRRLWHTVYF